MSQLIDVRIDKYLWAVRFFKTRTLASDQIENGKVKLFDLNTKSSKKIKVNDIIWVRKPEAHYNNANELYFKDINSRIKVTLDSRS
jgi:ribosomal 50S subunit-recycling heat shock protein